MSLNASSRSFLFALVLGLIAAPVQAVTWNWSFAGEAGTFVTDGVGGGAGTYNLLDFSVTTSAVGGTIGSLLGGEYTDGQFLATVLPYSFVYDGSKVTEWHHSGVNPFWWWAFDSPTSNISYFFGWESGNLNLPSVAAWWIGNSIGQHGTGQVTVTVSSGANAVPDSASGVLLLISGLGALLVARRRWHQSA